MTLKNLALIVAAALLLSVPADIAQADSGDIRWYSFADGIAQQEKEKKKVFLHFWADWCPSCKKMNRVTFADRSVIAYLNRHFISIKVDSDKESALARKFGVRGIPDNWFIAENGQHIGNRAGYLSPRIFLELLTFIRTDSYK